MTPETQLTKWVSGESIHNEERNECCPDFSCCFPEMRTSREEREAFRDGTPDDRDRMLITFLGRAMALYRPRGDVYIAGREEEKP